MKSILTFLIMQVTIGSDDLTANTRIKQIVEVIDERDKPEKLIKVGDLLEIQFRQSRAVDLFLSWSRISGLKISSIQLILRETGHS